MLICPTLIVLTTATYLTQASPATSPQPPALNYTDIGLFNSTANLERYVIFLAIGWRNYTCSTPNATTAPSYALTTFDYNMFDIDDSGAAVGDLAIGKHVLPLNKDYAGGNSVFYTGVRSFTYWSVSNVYFSLALATMEFSLTLSGWYRVGKSIKFLPGPAATSKADMMLELALVSPSRSLFPAWGADVIAAHGSERA